MLKPFALVLIGQAFIAPSDPTFVYTKISDRKYETQYNQKREVFTADDDELCELVE